MKSEIIELGPVSFPENTGERVYMLPFYKRAGLPEGLRRWQPTIDKLLAKIETPHRIFLMIDQGFVRAGQSQRRPGMHIDGYWRDESGVHGGDSGHKAFSNFHTNNGRWVTPTWSTSKFEDPEAIILASDVSGCRALVGEFEGVIGEGGDCSRLNFPKCSPVDLKPNIGYIGNVTMLHESIPVAADCFRTLVRLNLPGVSLPL